MVDDLFIKRYICITILQMLSPDQCDNMPNPFLQLAQQYSLLPLPNANAPIFLLSTIWRSGSTLLQRTIASDHSIQIWGEPYSDSSLIQMLTQSALSLTQPNWPTERHFLNRAEFQENPEEFFIANWYPPMQSMVEAHRAMLDRLFNQSACDLGKQRFGAKFVRLSIKEMYYLQWLYPDAKFIILVRNPWDCWKSYKGYQWMYRWPKGVIKTVQQFAKLWEHQTRELLSEPPLASVRVLRYEDFLHPDFAWDTLKDFCELPNINPATLNKRIKGVPQEPLPITTEDCQTIQQICGGLASQLGYHGLKETDTSGAIGDWRQ